MSPPASALPASPGTTAGGFEADVDVDVGVGLDVGGRTEDDKSVAGFRKDRAKPTQSKASRRRGGRLRKLRRLAALIPQGGEKGGEGGCRLSGIRTFADAEEMSGLLLQQQQLKDEDRGEGLTSSRKANHADHPLGPSVMPYEVAAPSTSSEPLNWRRCEGADHRDLILNLLFHDGKTGGGEEGEGGRGKKKGKGLGKKRKRAYSNADEADGSSGGRGGG